LILNLGRFEWGTYKNSQAALEVFQLIRSTLPSARMMVLEERKALSLPTHLAAGVEAIGFPDDQELSEIIRLADLGISTSLWEGFNLPLVELLQNGTPALALKVGAHAEVVPHPWFICKNRGEMAAKAIAIISDPDTARANLESSEAQAHWQHLSWERFIHELLAFVALPVPLAETS
jgi:glycosyltransferase involved in cell wall biosynthesis